MRKLCNIEDCSRPVRGKGYCNMHYKRWLRNGDALLNQHLYSLGTPEERYWKFIDKGDNDFSCWIWTGGVAGGGYGRFWVGDHYVQAHRYSYESIRGVIPTGLQLDHLCRNRRCVNPNHLEAVTAKVNLLRGIGPTGTKSRLTHCKRGHPFNKKNTYIKKNGTRYCRACGAAYKRENKLRNNNLIK